MHAFTSQILYMLGRLIQPCLNALQLSSQEKTKYLHCAFAVGNGATMGLPGVQRWFLIAVSILPFLKKKLDVKWNFRWIKYIRQTNDWAMDISCDGESIKLLESIILAFS